MCCRMWLLIRDKPKSIQIYILHYASVFTYDSLRVVCGKDYNIKSSAAGDIAKWPLYRELLTLKLDSESDTVIYGIACRELNIY